MIRNIRILLVEDECIAALDIENGLTNLGYTIVGTATTGNEAVKKAMDLHPDIVLMDIVLQGETDGISATEQIRDRFDIPVIYLTAGSDENTLHRAKLTEPYGYILKPFKEKELHIGIEMALYKHRMEKRLRDSEKWFSTTLRSIGDAVIATDKDGAITFMNPVAEKLTGWSANDALHKPLAEVFVIINKDTRQSVENPVARVLREGTTQGLANHTLLISKDGTELPIDDSAAPITDDHDNILGVILVFREVKKGV